MLLITFFESIIYILSFINCFGIQNIEVYYINVNISKIVDLIIKILYLISVLRKIILFKEYLLLFLFYYLLIFLI